jgi:restriction endonuclease S subunit
MHWQVATVADICEMRNGHGFGPEDWTTEGLPIIRIQNLNGGKNFDYFAGEADARWLVESGQLLFAWAGTKGVSFGPTVWRGPLGVLNQHIFQVSPKEGIDLDWLYWALRHVTDRIEASAHGFKATLVHVKKSDIDRQSVRVPPNAEQRRIARILATWDRAIAAAEQLSANSQKHQVLLANTLLIGRRRFGLHPPWVATPLSQMIRESRAAGSGGDTARKLTVKLYGRGVVNKSEKRVGSESTRYYRRTAGQFIYSKLDFLNGAFGRVPSHLDGYESTLDLPAFDFLSDVDPRWFLYFVSRPDFYLGQLGLANGGRKARRVNPVDLLAVCIDRPALSEQRAIADALDLANQDCAASKRRCEILKQEKAALMAQLLTGKRRVRMPAAGATP